MFQPPQDSSMISEDFSQTFSSPHDGDDEEELSADLEDQDVGDESIEYDVEEYEQEDGDLDEDVDEEDDEDDHEQYGSDGEMLSGSHTSTRDSMSENHYDGLRSSRSRLKSKHKITEPPEFILQTSSMLQAAQEILEPEDDNHDERALSPIDSMDIGRTVLSPPQREAHLQKITFLFLSSLNSFLVSARNERLESATYLATLLLPLYFPPPLDPSNISLNSNAHLLRHPPPSKPRPLVLLNWLNDNHTSPDSKYLLNVTNFAPNCATHPDFWLLVNNLALRCRLQDCCALLASANWLQRGQELPQSLTYPSEAGPALKRASALAQDTIMQCPAIAFVSAPSKEKAFSSRKVNYNQQRDENWETGSLPWRLWRTRIKGAIEELESMSQPDPDESLPSQSTTGGYFRSKKPPAPGLIPFSIASQFRVLFEILRGTKDVIFGIADNWFDAVGGLVAYHDMTGSSSEGMEIDEDEAYKWDTMNGGTYKEDSLRRITKLFHMVTRTEMPLPAFESPETALADILAGRIQDTLKWLAKDSLLVASASAEFLSWGGYCDNDLGRQVKKSLRFDDQDDDDEIQSPGIKEKVITSYAKALQGVGVLKQDSSDPTEGWQVGVLALKRVDTVYTRTVASDMVLNVQLDPSDHDRADRLLSVCASLGFLDEERRIASGYGSELLSDEQVGSALIYYAKAENRQELHNVLSSYTRKSLLAGKSIPEAADLDTIFESLLTSPEELKDNDLLRRELSGYAALRGLYSFKQDDRLDQAAATLEMLIRSAGEAVDCGVLNEDIENVINVECIGGLVVELLSAGGIFKELSNDSIFHILRVLEALFLVGGDVVDQTREFYNEVIEDDSSERERFKNIAFSEVIGFLRMCLAERLGMGWLSEESTKQKAKHDLVREQH